MELRHLRYFCAVAEQGNFTRAAATLHYTQTALSRQMKELEGELGVVLFERSPNSIRLTPAGEVFYEETLECLARVQTAVQRVRGEQTDGRLRIGYIPAITASFLPQALEQFRIERPRVRVELVELSDEVLAKQLADRLLDLGIAAMGAAPQSRGIEWSEIGRESKVLVMPAAHSLARRRRINPKSLGKERMIGYARALYPEYHRWIRATLKSFGVTPDFVEYADGLASIFTALSSQNAVVVLPSGISNLLPPTLVARTFHPPLSRVPIGVGLPKTGRKPDAERFVRHLSTLARKLT